MKFHGNNRNSLFQWIGKHIADSRTPHLLNQPRILEKGSLKGFLTGKSYNRCRIIHQILAAAMEIIHLRGFDSRFSNGNLHVLNDKLKLIKVEKKMFLKGSYWVLRGYLLFLRHTLEVIQHGTRQTTTRCFTFITSSPGIHAGDLDLSILCLPKIFNHFFVFNHHNYARWLALFHDNWN